MNSGRGKTPEEQEHDDVIEQEPDDEVETEEERILTLQQGHVPGRLPRDWGREAKKPGGKEISLDHATEDEWEDFLNSLVEEEE